MNSTAESGVTLEPARAIAKPRPSGLSYSLRSLLLVVTGIGLGLGALSYATALLSSVLFTATLALLLIAVLFAGFGAPRRRAFWSGFSIFGVAYLVLSTGPWFSEHVAPQLLTERALRYLNSRLAPPDIETRAEIERDGQSETVQVTHQNSEGKFRVFNFNGLSESWVNRSQLIVDKYVVEATRIGHSLFALLFALIGGWIAAFIARKQT